MRQKALIDKKSGKNVANRSCVAALGFAIIVKMADGCLALWRAGNDRALWRATPC